MYNEFDALGFGIGLVILVTIIIAVVLIPPILFFMTLQKSLIRCSPESRTMEPERILLMFIPIFNLVWQFMVVSNISSSLHNEFNKRGIMEDSDPGKSIGITYCVISLCSFIPLIGIIAALGGFVCWIIYWVIISGYSNKLIQPIMP